VKVKSKSEVTHCLVYLSTKNVISWTKWNYCSRRSY